MVAEPRVIPMRERVSQNWTVCNTTRSFAAMTPHVCLPGRYAKLHQLPNAGACEFPSAPRTIPLSTHVVSVFTLCCSVQWEASVSFATSPAASSCYTVSVRRLKCLSPASFRSPILSGHPCYWLMIRTVTLIRDLHPIADEHADAQKQKLPEGSFCSSEYFSAYLTRGFFIPFLNKNAS